MDWYNAIFVDGVEVEGVPLNELETVREIYTALDLTAAKDRAGA